MLGNRSAAASLNRVDLLTAFKGAKACMGRFKAQLRMHSSNKSLWKRGMKISWNPNFLTLLLLDLQLAH